MQKKAIIVFVREPRYLPIFVIHLRDERGVNDKTLIDATIAFYRHLKSELGYIGDRDRLVISESRSFGLHKKIFIEE